MIEQIWHDFNQQLLAFIRAKVNTRADAEDILQNVFLKVIQNLDTLKDETKLSAWLYQICRHSIIDHYRAGGQDQAKNIELHETLESELNEADQLAQKQQIEQLSVCLSTLTQELPDKYRTLLVEHEFKQIKQTELAKQFDLALPTTKSRIQRGRKLLKDKLKSCCEWSFTEAGPEHNCKTECGCS